jgi:hypothetical protein
MPQKRGPPSERAAGGCEERGNRNIFWCQNTEEKESAKVGEQPILRGRDFYCHEVEADARVGKLPSGREEKRWRKIRRINAGM